MRKVGRLTAGWLNTNIANVIDAGLVSQFQAVLITSIDSATDLANPAIRNPIAKFDPECSLLGSGIVVNGRCIERIANELKLFTGFDELWCFERPPKRAMPPDLWIVSPYNIETDPVSEDLSPWMIQTECMLGLGDGIGLNFVTPQAELSDRLRQLDK